ncbi:MAG: hypothetical protein GX962_17435 [Epulopiscium sp.]|nr:hypothetical protein [Candidatus Epulonipiscium sp.]
MNRIGFISFCIFGLIYMNSPFLYNEAKDKLLVQHNNGEENLVRVGFKYNKKEDLWIDFKKGGVNSLMGMGSFYLSSNLYPSTVPNFHRVSKVFLHTASDWVGPYIVRQGYEESGDKPRFTGGWHGSNGDETGSPTGRTSKVEVYIDGKIIMKDKVFSADEVQVHVTNYIQGYNTTLLKKEILKENVVYRIIHNNIDVSVELEALEDLVIERYYGLQALHGPWRGEIGYFADLNTLQRFSTSINSNSGLKKDGPNIQGMHFASTNGKHELITWLDRSYGLGAMDYVSLDQPCAFSLAYGKSYFNLIHGIEKKMETGEKLYWRGKYTFISK